MKDKVLKITTFFFPFPDHFIDVICDVTGYLVEVANARHSTSPAQSMSSRRKMAQNFEGTYCHDNSFPDIFICLSVFDSPEGLSSTFKTLKKISVCISKEVI